jgi:hypothetical protein
MKTVSAALAAATIAGLSWISAAQAQGVPPGSYRQSCSDARIEGGALVATCRTAHGAMQRTALPAVNRCAGDIGNNNGVLQCNTAGGPMQGSVQGPARGAEPGGRGPRDRDEPRGYGQREGYGERGYGREARERCFELRREAEQLRERLHRTYEPYERARVEGRLGEVRREEERCR